MPTAPVAALLLALQSLSGGLVSLVHAAERTSAPAAIEAEHTARCPVLHDAVKCPQCQHPGAYAVTRLPRSLVPDRTATESRAFGEVGVAAASFDRSVGRPRAPPLSLP